MAFNLLSFTSKKVFSHNFSREVMKNTSWGEASSDKVMSETNDVFSYIFQKPTAMLRCLWTPSGPWSQCDIRIWNRKIRFFEKRRFSKALSVFWASLDSLWPSEHDGQRSGFFRKVDSLYTRHDVLSEPKRAPEVCLITNNNNKITTTLYGCKCSNQWLGVQRSQAQVPQV